MDAVEQRQHALDLPGPVAQRNGEQADVIIPDALRLGPEPFAAGAIGAPDVHENGSPFERRARKRLRKPRGFVDRDRRELARVRFAVAENVLRRRQPMRLRIEEMDRRGVRPCEQHRLVENARIQAFQIALGRERIADFEKASHVRRARAHRAAQLVDFAHDRRHARRSAKSNASIGPRIAGKAAQRARYARRREPGERQRDCDQRRGDEQRLPANPLGALQQLVDRRRHGEVERRAFVVTQAVEAADPVATRRDEREVAIPGLRAETRRERRSGAVRNLG